MSIDVVEDITPRRQYTAAAAQTEFDYPFPIFADTDLKVYVGETLKTITTHYTVSGVGDDDGGTVTFLTAMTGGEIVTLYRDTTIERVTDFQQNGPNRSAALNDELDRVTVVQQELRSMIDRCLRLSRLSTASDTSAELAPLANWLERYVYINAGGEPEPAAVVTGTISQSIIGALLYPQITAESSAGVTPSSYAYPPGDVRRYGGVGDNSTDNTAALKRWARVASPGVRLTLEPGGVYLYDPFSDGAVEGILFQNCSGFVVDGQGATLKASNGASVGSGRQMMYLRNVQDAKFCNFIIDGNRANRVPAEVTAHNFTVSTNCQRVFVSNVRSINACCDGFYVDTQDRETLSTFPTDITFDRACSGFNAYRNCMSVINSVRCKISGRYHGANGTDPQDGIDIETGTGTFAGNYDIRIEDVDTYDNTGWGLSVGREAGSTATNQRPVLRNIRGTNNAKGFVRLDSAYHPEVDGLYCGAHSTADRGVVDLTATAVVNPSLRNLRFRDITVTGATKTCLYVHGSVSGRVELRDVRINGADCFAMLINKEVDMTDVQVIDVSVDPAVQVLSSTAAYSTLKNITIDTCTGRGLYIDAADVEVDGLTLIDCASTTASGFWATNALLPVVRNVNVLQRTSIPVGQKALHFATAPRSVQNCTAKSGSTDYTTANIFNFAGGLVGSSVSDCTPSATEASGTGTIASGAVQVLITHGLGVTPAQKDICITPFVAATNDYGRLYVDNVTSTQFRVSVTADPGASGLDFGWSVRARP